MLGKKEGEAVGALSHPEIGDIDLVWGEEGTSNSDGYSIAKLAKYHPEVLDNLQEIINDMRVTKRSANRVQLESDTHQAAVRLTWDNKSKNWLLTAFEKKNSVSDNTTDTGETSDGGKQNDTATLQNTISTDEGTTQSAKVQENTQKSGENAVEPVEENNESTISQTSDQVVDNAPGNGGVVDNNSANTLQNGNNELNLQKENESDNESNQNDIPVGGQVPQSVPQGEHGTQDSQVSGMEETASRLRERIEADGGTPQGGLSRNARDVENRVTREYAQENGLWIPFEDVFKLGRPSKSGNEHDTYLNAEQGVIYKVNNRMHTPSVLDLLDRIEQHNKYFPDSKYSLVGFTSVSKNGDVMPVFAQGFVPNARMATNEEIDSYMGALGFTRVGDGRYSNGEVVLYRSAKEKRKNNSSSFNDNEDWLFLPFANNKDYGRRESNTGSQKRGGNDSGYNPMARFLGRVVEEILSESEKRGCGEPSNEIRWAIIENEKQNGKVYTSSLIQEEIVEVLRRLSNNEIDAVLSLFQETLNEEWIKDEMYSEELKTAE